MTFRGNRELRTQGDWPGPDRAMLTAANLNCVGTHGEAIFLNAMQMHRVRYLLKRRQYKTEIKAREVTPRSRLAKASEGSIA